jgi:hypothetical protein
MRLCSLLILAACLTGCNQTRAQNSAEAAEHHGSRYLGIGIYPVTDLWEHIIGASRPSDPAAATLEDDTELIVVVDGNSGEIRQCGNMSGHCISMNPWTRPPDQVQVAPAKLDAHEVDLTHIRDAAANAAEAAASAAEARHR